MSTFTRNIPSRCFAALLSLLLMAPTGWGVFTYVTIDHSNDNPDWVLRLLLHAGMEIIALAFCLSILGVLWAIFTPAWLSRVFSFCSEHFVSALAAFLVVIIGMLAFSFLA